MREPTQRGESGDGPHLGEVLDFMQRLWAVDQGLHTISKHMLARLGVTGPQRLVVRIVGKFPRISAGRLAEILRIHPSTLTGVLKRLERHGLLERLVDPDDHRRALFRLTTKGKKLDGQHKGTVEAVIQRALQKIPEHELAAARSVLRRLGIELERGL